MFFAICNELFEKVYEEFFNRHYKETMRDQVRIKANKGCICWTMWNPKQQPQPGLYSKTQVSLAYEVIQCLKNMVGEECMTNSIQ